MSEALSAIMPVYNGARYLAPAIESILFQTYRDFEFVILDDGSTDATPGILARFAASDPRIRVLRVGEDLCRAPGLRS